MNARVMVLPGDGIGPEVTRAAVRVLSEAADRAGHTVSSEEAAIGGASIDLHGRPLTDETLERCRASDAVLLGAVGGPRWDDEPHRPEQGLLDLRHGLGVFANLRPVHVKARGGGWGPLRSEVTAGTDLLFVRELTGGLYFSRPHGIEGAAPARVAVDTLRYTEHEIRRVVRVALGLAEGRRRRLHSIDKANVLASSRLWRSVVDEEALRLPHVATAHVLVDAFALRLLTHPTTFDVVVTENLFGDILTDEAAALAGSLGVLPSASLGAGGPGLYEPVHGSAPDIAGRGVANPVGAILSAALLARHSLGWTDVAAAIEAAVDATSARGIRTPDLGGESTTAQVTEAVWDALPSGRHALTEVAP